MSKMVKTKEEYCNPINREAIALTAPSLLDFYDAYCDDKSEVCLLPEEDEEQPLLTPPKEERVLPVAKSHTPDSPTAPDWSEVPLINPPDRQDDDFFYVWVVAAVMVLLIIAVGLYIL